MPFIDISNAGPLDDEQRRALAREITELIHKVTGKPRSSVYIRMDEVPRLNFAVGGQLLADRDAAQKQG